MTLKSHTHIVAYLPRTHRHPPRADRAQTMPRSGTLSRRELQRIVAEMLG
jgi:hypothetical protein